MELTKCLDIAGIRVHRSMGYIHVVWLQAPTSLQFRSVMLDIYSTLKETGFSYILASNEHLGIVSPDDQEWTYYKWLEKTLTETNYRGIANIVSSNFFTQLGVESIMNEAVARSKNPNPLQAYFHSEEDAKLWLFQLMQLV